jgi:hypothetical protein
MPLPCEYRFIVEQRRRRLAPAYPNPAFGRRRGDQVRDRAIVFACREEARRGPLRVNRVNLADGWPLPVYPEQQTFFAFGGMFQRCQSTKSLRSSPLRGGKIREAGSQLREQRWRV